MIKKRALTILTNQSVNQATKDAAEKLGRLSALMCYFEIETRLTDDQIMKIMEKMPDTEIQEEVV